MNTSICLVAGIDPMLLPITNHAVSTNGATSVKGIAISIGEPAQLFSVRPAANQNNTFITNAGHCGIGQAGVTNYSCVAENGGVYLPPANALVANDPTAWNGTPGDVYSGDGLTQVLFNDKLQIANHSVLGFPFFTYEGETTGYTLPSSLALGSNSSFIEAAVQNELIGTRQWSVWPGNKYEELDGLLVLGGYPEDLVSGGFSTFSTTAFNQMGIEITNLQWQFSNGTTTSLMPENSTTSLWALLEPFHDYIQLPGEPLLNFFDATEGVYNATIGDYVYYTKPTGNMVVEVVDGTTTMTTTIPADDLFGYPEQWDDRGRLTLSPSGTSYYTSKTSYDDAYPGDGGLWFGQPFLTQVLLVADYERAQFHLAKAVKSNLGTGAPNIKSLCTGGPSASTPSPSPGAPPQPPHKKTNIAAIAGGVVGGIGGVLIMAGVAFSLIRRRKKAKNQSQAHTPYMAEDVAAEPPYRGSTTSPPPKYAGATSTIYETGSHSGMHSPPPDQHRFSPPPNDVQQQMMQQGYMQPLQQHSQQPLSPDISTGVASPRSDGGYSHWSATTAGKYEGQHEMSSENRFAATSGPVEMPNNYDERR